MGHIALDLGDLASVRGVAGDSGLYYEESRPKQPGPAVMPELAGELWEHNEAWVNGSA
jgi:hypothetical protein